MTVTYGDAPPGREHGSPAGRPATPDATSAAVVEIAAWIPVAYRQAYLAGAAVVLGRRARSEDRPEAR